MYAVVLFDLDGTLTDPGRGIANSVSHALERLGRVPMSASQLRAFVGPPLQDSFVALGLNAAEVELAVTTYRQYFSTRGLYENEVYAGVDEVLTVLRTQGSTLAVATSKPAVYAEQILDHFGLRAYFDHVAGATLDGSRRYKHDVIDEAQRALDVAAGDDVVMVGDRAEDVRGAIRSGVDCLGAGWGYGEDGELEAAGAIAVLRDPPELLVHLVDQTRRRGPR